MTKLIDLMPDAKDVYVGKGITVYDVKQRLRKLEAVREVSQHFLLEVSHAMQCGPGWYTHGENGLRKQIYMWIERERKALADCGDET